MDIQRLPRHYCSYQGHRVAYALVGRGPLIVLLHGLGGTADVWQPLLPRLAPTYTVLCPDLIGFGASDKPKVAYTAQWHAGAVAAAIEAAGGAHIEALVGHSCGGVVALTLVSACALHPQRLVLAATPFPSPRFPVREELLKSPGDRMMMTWYPLAQTVHQSLSLLWPLLRHISVAPQMRGAYAGYMEHTIQSYVSTAEECLFRANIDPLLPNLQPYPTLLLYGRDDRTVPFVHGQRLAGALAHSELVPLADGHFAILQEGIDPLVAWLGTTTSP